MLTKLKRMVTRNSLKVRSGVGFVLCLVGAGLIINLVPSWALGIIAGGGSLFLGIQLLKG
ncbi:hypothetical protein MWH28_11540 [Natroniella sulfidigena]|uniref:hypothetical protein n=1 Tax=Natroniella sulfidigena TaxID=723921 RepID=UPI00200A1089|nr:hypothetical protein [Natroniella sulfidigena]MCK8817989.1 hypothetical protein [Natroniella sulfidigena]